MLAYQSTNWLRLLLIANSLRFAFAYQWAGLLQSAEYHSTD